MRALPRSRPSWRSQARQPRRMLVHLVSHELRTPITVICRLLSRLLLEKRVTVRIAEDQPARFRERRSSGPESSPRSVRGRRSARRFADGCRDALHGSSRNLADLHVTLQSTVAARGAGPALSREGSSRIEARARPFTHRCRSSPSTRCASSRSSPTSRRTQCAPATESEPTGVIAAVDHRCCAADAERPARVEVARRGRRSGDSRAGIVSASSRPTSAATRARSIRPGSGSGSRSARRIVEAHGGTDRASRRGRWAGARFVFELPVHGPRDATGG